MQVRLPVVVLLLPVVRAGVRSSISRVDRRAATCRSEKIDPPKAAVGPPPGSGDGPTFGETLGKTGQQARLVPLNFLCHSQ
jgi:hypothetical protein